MPLSNFGLVAPGVYRAAQPDREGWRTLLDLGIKAVVKLNEEQEYPKIKEASDAGPGIQIAAMPINQWNPLMAQVYGVAFTIERFIQDEQPMLVHCTHGRDRTGLAIGAWRLKFCGWNFKQVQEERAIYGVTGIVALADYEITECLQKIADAIFYGKKE